MRSASISATPVIGLADKVPVASGTTLRKGADYGNNDLAYYGRERSARTRRLAGRRAMQRSDATMSSRNYTVSVVAS